MVLAGTALRDLRALRFAPPGFAGRGARRQVFQAALDQCEQFLVAAHGAGYATRPVQLFYALSQAGRAIVAASPRIGNQSWQVTGHGISAKTSAQTVADVTVTAAPAGLMPSVAAALGVECLVPREPVALRELWPLLPEARSAPLVSDAQFPVLLLLPGSIRNNIADAWLSGIPRQIKEQYGNDVKEYLGRYPALLESMTKLGQPLIGSMYWGGEHDQPRLALRWEPKILPVMCPGIKTTDELCLMTYRSTDDLVVTPTIGSMATGLHPLLALWAVLLALSSLARYEPASWAKMIDIDRSAEANAIEHILDESLRSLHSVVLNQLVALDQACP
jgi:hypothetical protein